MSFVELVSAVNRSMLDLQAAGICSTSIVGVGTRNEAEHLVQCIALLAIKASQFTLSHLDPPAARAALEQRMGATHRLESSRISMLAASPPPGSPCLPGTLRLATSGTSGRAKQVVLNEESLVLQAPRHVENQAQRFACLAPIQHNFAKRHRLYCAAQGAVNLFFDVDDPDRCVRDAERMDATTLHVSALQARGLLSTRGSGHFRQIRLKIGGSHVPLGLRQQIQQELTADLWTGYGTTETGAIAFARPDDHDELECVGQPLPGLSVSIRDQAGQDLPTGERGEITVCGDGLFLGYLADAGGLQQSPAHSCFSTGDIGFIDRQGRLIVCGRQDDMFVFNSMNIHPQEIESCLRDHAAVRDAVVIPKPSAVHGGIPVALVEVEVGMAYDAGELRRWVQQQVGIRCPRQFFVVDQLPRHPSGKLDRTTARALYEQSSTDD
ncbi:MAG: hypothetical protein CMP06_10515 [Xanthomonadales bacterium]|jgi:acyl-coenzyme A synthetase/AMP-(fatty) acid ligase|nr:hypothetical protein [Xanthomonadales bacterium]